MPQVNITAVKGLVVEGGSDGIIVETYKGAGCLVATSYDSQAAAASVTIPVTTIVSKVEDTTDGSDAWTLADGLTVGQIKCVIVGGDDGEEGIAVMTPVSFADGTDVTFSGGVEASWTGIWDGSAWRTIIVNYVTIS